MERLNIEIIVVPDVTDPGLNQRRVNIAVDGFDGASGQIALRIEPSRPPVLSAAKRLPDGTFQFLVSGLVGRTYELDSSSNFTSWTSIGLLVNTNGSFTFTDPAVTSFVRQFYRAVQMP